MDTTSSYVYPLFMWYGVNSRLISIHLDEASGRTALEKCQPKDDPLGPDEEYVLEEWPINEPATRFNVRVVDSR